MVNITFTPLNSSKSYSVELNDNFTLTDIRNAVPELGDLIQFRLLIDDDQLCLEKESIFNRQKPLILQNPRITLLRRAPGGTFIEISLLKQILLEDLKEEFKKLDLTTSECYFCKCPELCATIHHTNICVDCFPNYLHDTNFQLRCMREVSPFHRYSMIFRGANNITISCSPTDEEKLGLDFQDIVLSNRRSDKNLCTRIIDYQTFFKSSQFIDKWSILCEITDLIKNIDCQICYCGALLFNMTMFAKQQCTSCQRWLCFFCNRNWNDQCMKNGRFTCTDDDCEYQRRLSFDLVPLQRNKALMVPDRRCCPNCFIVGGYGIQCKYHGCPHCKHQFCFICLETEEDCKRIYKVDCDHQCAPIKKQNYSMFPCINEETEPTPFDLLGRSLNFDN
ncbi:unnamed protein product [Rotaria socialis]|nr:unnamed protein product [Rotaria socialis]CAF3585216.1 unnamed protein product [Rotaria socialis]CAF3779770.1 unnamed protein product [Rotaria socialis]CAF4580882.1 unnamed protein product [Rotaria socialis]